MPSTYAHYRLGQQVRQALSGPQREAVEAWPALYLIGLHGRDILFYYHPLSSHPVKAVGHLLHGRPGRGFFRHACQVIRESQRPEAALAYAYGVLNHFALDMTCHPYVNGTAAAGDLTHTKIEVEFDRSLMVADGLDPVTYDQTGHIQATLENAEVIAPFYPVVTDRQVRKALDSMVFYHHLVICPDGDPRCVESDTRLRSLYDLARDRALQFLQDFDAYRAGKAPLPEPFQYNFEGVKGGGA